MVRRFRNVAARPDDQVREWPAEAVESALDRGSLGDWRRLAAEVHRSPWGSVARTVMTVAGWGEHPGLDEVMQAVVATARKEVVGAGRAKWAGHIRSLRWSTGLSMRAFAALAGTSASRLSDYENARVAPTTDVLAKLEHTAAIAAAATPPSRRPVTGSTGARDT